MGNRLHATAEACAKMRKAKKEKHHDPSPKSLAVLHENWPKWAREVKEHWLKRGLK